MDARSRRSVGSVLGVSVTLVVLVLASSSAGARAVVRDRSFPLAVIGSRSVIGVASASENRTLRRPVVDGSAVWSSARASWAFLAGGFLWTSPVTDRPARRGPRLGGDRVVWDPGGRFVVSFTSWVAASERASVFVAPIAGGHPRRLRLETPPPDGTHVMAIDVRVDGEGSILVLERSLRREVQDAILERLALERFARDGTRLAPLRLGPGCLLPWVVARDGSARACVAIGRNALIVCKRSLPCRRVATSRDIAFVSSLEFSTDGSLLRIATDWSSRIIRVSSGMRVTRGESRAGQWPPHAPQRSETIQDLKSSRGGTIAAVSETSAVVRHATVSRFALLIRSEARGAFLRIRIPRSNLRFVRRNAIGLENARGFEVYSPDGRRRVLMLRYAFACFPSSEGSYLLCKDGTLVTVADGSRRHATSQVESLAWIDDHRVLAETTAGLEQIDAERNRSTLLASGPSSLRQLPGGRVEVDTATTSELRSPDGARVFRRRHHAADAPETLTPDGALSVRWTVPDGNGVCRLIVTPFARRSPPRVTVVPRCSLLTEATVTVTNRLIVSIGQDGQHEEDQRYLVNVLDLKTGNLTVDQGRYEQVTKTVRDGYLLVVDDHYQAGTLDLATGRFTPYGLSAPGVFLTLGAPVDWLDGDEN